MSVTLKDYKLYLQRVLDEAVESKGSFAFQKSYQDFPNPCLSVEGLGQIGLPLSSRDAKALITECSQAPFGQGTKTIVDTTVRKTWQLDASKVSFEHPNWVDFIRKVLCEACEGLGVNSISQPVGELYKLLLYEPGSHFKAHQDTEKSPGMFGTMVIILPSKFTGGDIHLKHAESSKIFKCSSNSNFNISVLSWYTDVFHEVKTIDTGYRLALSFNLLHKNTVHKPIIPSDIATGELRLTFQTWAQRRISPTPSKLIYLLDHEYSDVGLRASLLKGIDAKKVTMMSQIGTPLGFKFALAKVKHTILAGTDNPYDSTVLGNIDYIHMEDMEFGTPVNLEGSIVDIDITSNEPHSDRSHPSLMYMYGNSYKSVFVPEDLPKRIRERQPDGCSKEPYQGNYGGDASLWYHRTVLVIWRDDSSQYPAQPPLTKRVAPSRDKMTARKRTKEN